ncbi:hypothetical protein AMECASPLE_039454 [Ameca splendens]|uniref:Uncharacterized protein n=1 Tax=Ameca splendens TaxID=208324 RepID=A0ABV0XLK5_9TELE
MRFCIQGFATKICNSECEDPQACPMVPGRTLRRSESQTSKGPPKHRNPRRTTARTTATPPEKSSGESQGNHPAVTVQKPQGLNISNKKTYNKYEMYSQVPIMFRDSQLDSYTAKIFWL